MTANKILLVGATGRTAKHFIPLALDRGYDVVALVRNPDGITLSSERLTIIQGLPTEIKDVRHAMMDCSAVISFLSPLTRGAAISFRKINSPHVLEKSVFNLLEVMGEYSIRRIMVLSTVGAGDSWKYTPWYVKLLGKFTNFRIIFEDHTAQETLIQSSKTNWTIVRPVGLNEKEVSGQLFVTYNRTPMPFQMSRMLLAKFFVDNIFSDVYFHKMPMVSEKST